MIVKYDLLEIYGVNTHQVQHRCDSSFTGFNTHSCEWSKQNLCFHALCSRIFCLFLEGLDVFLSRDFDPLCSYDADITHQHFVACEISKVNKEIMHMSSLIPCFAETSKYENIPKTLGSFRAYSLGAFCLATKTLGGFGLTIYKSLGHSIRMTNHGITFQTRRRNHRAQKVLSFSPRRTAGFVFKPRLIVHQSIVWNYVYQIMQ